MVEKEILPAIVAMASEKNLRDFADGFALALATRGQLYVVHARHCAAVDTDEMRVSGIMVCVNGLKPPDVIAQLGAAEQSRVRHVVEISKSCRLVNARGRQVLGDNGMRYRRSGLANEY